MKEKGDQGSNNNSTNNSNSTFIIKIEHCQNNTWQGKVTWAEENKKVNFRSALELMNLMNEALEYAQKQGEQSVEHSVS